MAGLSRTPSHRASTDHKRKETDIAAVGLLYVGGALFVNAVMRLGRAEPRGVGIFNLFVGVLQVVVPFYIIATVEDPNVILNALGIFLCGFTYLYVGITNLGAFDTTGLGWYCLWVAIIAVAYSLLNFFYLGNPFFGVIWLMWSFLWGPLFYPARPQEGDHPLHRVGHHGGGLDHVCSPRVLAAHRKMARRLMQA